MYTLEKNRSVENRMSETSGVKISILLTPSFFIEESCVRTNYYYGLDFGPKGLSHRV